MCAWVTGMCLLMRLTALNILSISLEKNSCDSFLENKTIESETPHEPHYAKHIDDMFGSRKSINDLSPRYSATVSASKTKTVTIPHTFGSVGDS